MVKRIFVILIALLCLFPVSSSVAYADAIAEPGNDFFSRHSSQILYLGRSFVASSETGNVGVKKEPGSRSDIGKIENGEEVFVHYSCLYDGEYWGLALLHSGWVRLDQMLVLYDYVAFAEDHLDELYDYSGDYEKLKETRSAVVWPWPGADAPLWTLEDIDTDSFWVFHAYTDEEGREWGFVAYSFGSRDIWICLSDPLNRDLPVFNPAPPPAVWVSETAHVDIKQYEQEKNLPVLIAIIVLVAALVVGTTVLIRVFWKPDKTRRER